MRPQTADSASDDRSRPSSRPPRRSGSIVGKARGRNPNPPTQRDDQASSHEPDKESTRSGVARSRKSGKSSNASARVLAESKQWSKLFVVTAAIAVVVLGVMTLVTSRWVSTNPQSLSGGSSLPTTWNFDGDYWHEVGYWSACNCTTLNSGPTCSARTSKMRALQGFTTLMVLSHIFALLAFVVSSFISYDLKIEIAIAAGFGTAALSALLSWAMCVVLFLDDACGVGSFAAQGFSLQWAFGLRIAESVGLCALTAMCVMRLMGLINQWPAVMLASTLLLVLNVASTTSHVWFQGSPPDAVGKGAVQVGPFAVCSCVDSTAACSTISSRLQGIQAMALIHLLLAVIQCILVCFVPEVLRVVPFVAVLSLAWVSWLVDVTKWGLAIGVFTSCSCPLVVLAEFSWPIAVAIIEFLLQCVVSVILTVGYAKQRLIEWHTSKTPHFFEVSDAAPAATTDLRSIYDSEDGSFGLKPADRPVSGDQPASSTSRVDVPLAPMPAVSRIDLENLQRPGGFKPPASVPVFSASQR